MKINYLIVFLYSMLVFLVTCVAGAYSIYAAAGVESFVFMALTYILLQKYDQDNTHTIAITSMIIIGRIILEIPVRVFDFVGSLSSMSTTLCCLTGIILGALYYREKRSSVLILSIIILFLLITIGVSEWQHMILRDY